jgi:membrane protease YdiL (CAAX protease family)
MEKLFKVIKDIYWNCDESRLRAGIRIIFSMFLFFLIYKAYILVLNSIGIMLFYSSETSLWIFLIAGTVRLLPVIIILCFGGRFIDRRNIKNFGFHFSKNWWFDLCFGISLGAFLISFIFIVEMIFGFISITDTIHSINSQSIFIVPLLVFLFYFICQCMSEEFLSRGYLLKNLAEGFNLITIKPKWAILTAWSTISIIFGLAHFANPNANIISTINLIVMGIVMGAGIIYTGELAIPIGLHISWNFFQGNIYGFAVSGLSYPAEIVSLLKINQSGPELWTGGDFGPEAGLIGLCANVIGLLLIFYWLYIRRGTRFGDIHTPLADTPINDF